MNQLITMTDPRSQATHYTHDYDGNILGRRKEDRLLFEVATEGSPQNLLYGLFEGLLITLLEGPYLF